MMPLHDTYPENFQELTTLLDAMQGDRAIRIGRRTLDLLHRPQATDEELVWPQEGLDTPDKLVHMNQ